jgi:quinolinate synthase
MLRYVRASSRERFIIGTEEGLLHGLRKENPGRLFYLLSANQVCTDMKKTTLEMVVQAMGLRQNVITIPEEVRLGAKQAIDRMLAVG